VTYLKLKGEEKTQEGREVLEKLTKGGETKKVIIKI